MKKYTTSDENSVLDNLITPEFSIFRRDTKKRCRGEIYLAQKIKTPSSILCKSCLKLNADWLKC
jgi:hypothetical protein